MTTLPYTGPIPPIGYGTYPLQGEAARRAVEMALEVGFRHLDTAQWYGNEDAVGDAVAACGLARHELFIATKVHPGNLVAERFKPSLDESLDKLKLAQVDLLLVHWPPRDPAEFEPTLERLTRAQDDGLAH